MQRRTFLIGCLPLLLPIKFSFAGTPGAQTGLVLDRRFADHLIDERHVESPKRYQALVEKLQSTEFAQPPEPLSPHTDASPWINTIHPQSHIDALKRQDPDAYQSALLACSGVLTAVDAVCAGTVQNAFCASRPPGHHATDTGREEGFCYINHVAVAARYLQQHHGYDRILIVDWDYHHGNGTEWAFYDDPSVLFFSTHDLMAYPRTGLPSRTGSGAGKGFNINVNLPCGSGDAEVIAAFESQLIPAANQFKPDFMLISAGFDSREADLLGCHKITDAGFAQLTRIVKKLALDHCQGRLVSVLEGGYNIEGNALAALAHLNVLNDDN